MKDLSFHINIWYLIIVTFYGWTCSSQEKKILSPQDYNLWHTLKMGVTSDDGKWTSFSKLYENNSDTLFFKNTITNFQYAFPSGHNEMITSKGNLFGFLKSETLFILETLTGKQEKYPGVIKFQFTNDGKYLIYQCNSKVSSRLVLKNIKTGQVQKFENIKEYRLSPTEKYLAIIESDDQNESVKLINLSELKKQTILSQIINSRYQQLTWNSTGNSLAYYISDKEKEDYKIAFAPNVIMNLNIYYLNPFSAKNFPIDGHIIKTKLYISDNGDKVFFDTKPNSKISEGITKVQVWKSSDKEIPPKSKINFMQWNVWLPSENLVYEIEDNNLIACGMTDNYQQAVLLDNNVYLPLHEYGDRYSDVYLMDLNSGIKKKIIEKQLRVNHHIGIDPKGNYIAYFKDKNWWSYNIKTKKHTCLTKDIQAIFNKSNSDRLDNHRAYGFGGWTTTGQIIVYDQFDIWLFSADGKKYQRLTNGSNDKVCYRINTYLQGTIRDNFIGDVSEYYDLNRGLIIRTLNTEKLSEGFGIWNTKDGFVEIVHKDSKIIYISKIGKNNSFQFLESRFDVSPKLISTTIGGNQIVIAQSNEQQKHFYWGRSELINYQSPNGKELKGALFYPANYNVKKKYPMIVSIYENKSRVLHEYIFPSLRNFIGFNITNFTSEDYFVLLPDIDYKLNNPGKSALDCVLSAVDKAIIVGSIDENNIGLVGHSFGGFETSYIISQTDKFKAAISSAGVNDLLSFYLDIDSSNLSNMERFESEQFRNKIPFTESKFLSESPIMNVKTINTPVLLWTGSNDKMVNPSYSTKLYAALWRLEKEATFLIYANEEHVLINPSNQMDITSKTMSWFNHHLKGFPKEDWIND
ncbi:S9 family peptidase [Gelidibacter sp. F63206]|uniref:S9 family peptidase n=1 Tax=Gelidibacter sp. F63206 TaxID=2926425 RepID=UPI001FF50344|nr:prolyl oligopeptidase family serine peptidase [Gelidibacter sp. F63206]MCK0115241.1 prolyl oligopeptidase family serine peptidase [Gelidibacter sp. F63206]